MAFRNPAKWSNTLEQFVDYYSVFGHFVGLALKGLMACKELVFDYKFWAEKKLLFQYPKRVFLALSKLFLFKVKFLIIHCDERQTLLFYTLKFFRGYLSPTPATMFFYSGRWNEILPVSMNIVLVLNFIFSLQWEN